MGIRKGKLAGVPISLDYSYFVIFSLTAWTIGFTSMPEVYPGLSQLEYLFIGTLSALRALRWERGKQDDTGGDLHSHFEPAQPSTSLNQDRRFKPAEIRVSKGGSRVADA